MTVSRRGSTKSVVDEEIGFPRLSKAQVGWGDEEAPKVNAPEPVKRARAHRWYFYARFLYVSDSYLSQAVYQSYALCVFAVILTAGGGVAYHYVDNSVGMFDGMWATFTWISTGILNSGLTPTSVESRSIASVLVILGILYFSIVLALVVEAVQGKMQALRQGKSTVVERGHTVMLGWTEKSLLFIREIINANESEGGGVIVVLCKDSKEKMERELSLFIKKRELKGTSIVFRQGSRLMIGDLDKVSVHTARHVVVFSDSTTVPDKADAEVLQVILNLSNLDLAGHVVAEVRDKDNEALIHLIGRGNVETVVSHDIIGRLMLMSVRQPGLAEVYGSVLGFEGDEFYTKHWKKLIGVKYKDVHLMLPDAVPVGVKLESGAIELNPRHDYVMGPSDELVVIAEDNDTYKPKQKHKCTPGKVPKLRQSEDEREFILFAGWRRDLRDILLLLDHMCPTGSEIHIMANVPLSDRDALLSEGGLEVDMLRNITLIHHVGNTAMRRHLEAVGIERFTSCIVFADEEEEGDIMQSDSKSLATLLLIRDIQSHNKDMIDRGFVKQRANQDADGKIPIVTEILDPRTQQTIQQNPEMRSVSDFLQSNDMVSKILAMVCEDRSVKSILDQMLAPRGASMACIPASRYAQPGESLSFFEMACRCQEFGETLLGYLEKDPSQSTGFKMPVINSKDKWRKFCWDGFVCCLLTGGPAVDALMASRSKYMDSSFAKKMGLGLSSVLEVNEGEFKKLVSDAFRRFDEDGSGTLELPEILEAFKTLPLESVSEADVEKKFEEFDEDDSGALDFDEFSALMRVLRQERTLEKFAEVPEEEFLELLKDSFKRFDADDSGELELEEIIQAFKTLPLKDVSEDQVRATFTRFDVDKSGALDYEEFADLMRELRKENAKQATKRRPRMDAAERRSVRNVVGMAEVKLGRLAVDDRDLAMAQIQAFVNGGEVVLRTREDGEEGEGGGGGGGSPDPTTNARAPSPAEDAGGSSRRLSVGDLRGGDLRRRSGRRSAQASPRDHPSSDAPRDEWHSNRPPSSLPPIHPPPKSAAADAPTDLAMAVAVAPAVEGGSGSPQSTLQAVGASSVRTEDELGYASVRGTSGASGGVVVAGGRVVTTSRGADPPRNARGLTEAHEYAEYIADRLVRMPAMRRNQVVQIVDLLSDAFACGQSVPATRLLGVISSFQAFPGGASSRRSNVSDDVASPIPGALR